ncbi:MAG: nucleotidyltransferase domain-containing protein, partial [Clostridium sp.]
MSNLLDKSTILEKLYSDDFKVFVQKFKLDNIMVFGSLLTEEFSDESDVDIALLGDEAIALDDILEIELFLEDFLGRAIDVVDLRSSTLDIFIKI